MAVFEPTKSSNRIEGAVVAACWLKSLAIINDARHRAVLSFAGDDYVTKKSPSDSTCLTQRLHSIIIINFDCKTGILVEPMIRKDRELLAQRLTQILLKLNQGQTLAPAALAEKFGVNLRTIQRDLSERLGFLPLEKVNGEYRLHPSALGKLNIQDLRRFANLAGVQGLFPDLSLEFLRELFDQRVESAWLVKGHAYESHSGRENLFAQLEQAIHAQQSVSFAYAKAQLDGQCASVKTYEPIHPYKLVSHSGVWYLAAAHDDKLKAFALGKIDRLLIQPDTFVPRADLLDMLAQEDSIWLNAKKSEVVLKVAKAAAFYFERRKLVSGQTIEKHLEDGGLIISAQIAHPNQILPIVRYWIPHVRIISPEGLQGEMENGLQGYLGYTRNNTRNTP